MALTPLDFQAEAVDELDPVAVWAADPERIDPDEYPPGTPYVREVTWADCPECSRQVHLSVAQYLYHGLRCPGCDLMVLPPPSEPELWLRRILREEAELTEQVS